MSLKLLHQVTGILVVVLFLLSGLYLYRTFPTAYALDESIRYLYRANHVYLLFAGLLNLLLGTYLTASPTPWRALTQKLGSTLALIGPAILLGAFIFEPPQALPERPLTLVGVVCMLAGTGFHWLANLREAKTV